jgi:hypothetical protein
MNREYEKEVALLAEYDKRLFRALPITIQQFRKRWLRRIQKLKDQTEPKE